MAILDAGDLLDQSRRLIASSTAGPPRQADIRRAISSAYYSVFHATLTAAADEFVGRTYRSSIRYAHVYRSVDHGRLRAVCDYARQTKPAKTASATLAAHRFGADIQAFADLAIALQEGRIRADYDPIPLFRTADARGWINTAEAARSCFAGADRNDRRAFLTLLLFPGRRGA